MMMSGYLVTLEESDRQFKHLTKPGQETVAGKPSADVTLSTLNSILKQAGPNSEDFMWSAIAIEKTENNRSGYVSGLPGCITTGTMIEEIEELFREARKFLPMGSLLPSIS